MRSIEIFPGVRAHASGGLWLEESRTLVLADLHLGYGWAQRRRGQLGPLADQETRSKLALVLDELLALKLLLLGDIVHAPNPGAEEAAFIRSTLGDLAGRTELICVRGNHDRGFGVDFAALGVALLDEWREDGWRMVHGDRLPEKLGEAERLATGHWHPAVGLEDASGVKQRIPAFLVAGPVVVLPAFSPFAAGVEVWRDVPEEIVRLSQGAPARAIAATGKRAVALGAFGERPSPAAGTRPRDYRASK